MLDLPADTWLRFAIWMLIGVAIYHAYGRRHSRLAGAEGEAAVRRLAADREARRPHPLTPPADPARRPHPEG
jgi:APA family basic amino acid/polyamine antiporter